MKRVFVVFFMLVFAGILVSQVRSRGQDTQSQSPGIAVRKYTTSWKDQTSVTVTHNLGTTAVLVQVFDASGALVEAPSITVSSLNVVTLTFGVPFSGSVVVIG